MGLCFGFRLNPRLRYSVPLHSPHFFTNSPFFLSSSSSSAGGRETFFNHTRLSLLSTIYEEGETLQKDFGKAFAFSSSAVEAPENVLLQGEGTKVNKGKRLLSSVNEMIDNTQLRFGESHFRLLMENLGVLEETFADSEALRLEKDIILQLEKLGALELFNICLIRSFGTSLISDHTDEENKRSCEVDDCTGKVVVRSSKKKENKTRGKRALVATAASSPPLPLEDNQEDFVQLPETFVKRASNTKNRRIMIAKREAQMSEGVKVLAELEKIKTTIEEDTKQVVSLSSWAEASGVDEKVLQQQLHYGYYCRDELIRSTRSLVLYFARKYRGMGIALEDLLQAGYIGVLQGAERFDSTRGYRFSTYVQYWIRKSMSRMVARYARGITIPWSLGRAINQIQKARKVLKNTSMKWPDDHEIAKMTGLSLDRIRSASNCLRIVASTNQKMGDRGVEYMKPKVQIPVQVWGYEKGLRLYEKEKKNDDKLLAEFITSIDLLPDTSIESPEETVMKQHLRKDIYDLLRGLDSRERQILTLRFGLNDHQPKSLEYIGRIFKVSKEWIRKIENKALTKLRIQATTSKLNYYLDL